MKKPVERVFLALTIVFVFAQLEFFHLFMLYVLIERGIVLADKGIQLINKKIELKRFN